MLFDTQLAKIWNLKYIYNYIYIHIYVAYASYINHELALTLLYYHVGVQLCYYSNNNNDNWKVNQFSFETQLLKMYLGKIKELSVYVCEKSDKIQTWS